MARSADYAVRIAKVTNKSGTFIIISFGHKLNLNERCKTLHIEFGDYKTMFEIIEDKDGSKQIPGHNISCRFRVAGVGLIKNLKLERKSNIYKAFTKDAKVVELLDKWVGEYADINPFPKEKWLNPNTRYSFWLNLCQKESFTNMDVRGNYDLETIKKPDCIADILDSPKENDLVSEEDVKNAVMSNNYAPASFSEMLQKQAQSIHEGLNKLFGVPAEPMEINPENDPRNHVNELFKELTYTAHKCTDEIQSSMADIFDYQLRKVHVTYEEANKNIKLQQILLRYIKLQDELEELFGGSNDVL